MRENIPAKLLAWSLTAPDSELAAVLEHIDKLVAARASGGVVLEPSTRFLFHRSGRVWRVVFEGEEFHLEDTLGARYLMGRPTKSRSLYSQMVGRSTRPLPGVVDGPGSAEERRAAIAASAKPSCLVVDFVGNAGKHKLVTSADILGGKVSEEAQELAMTRARKAGKPVNMAQALDEAEADLKQQEQERLAEAARRAQLVATAQFSTEEVDPFDAYDVHPVAARGRDSVRQLTAKQRSLLAKQGINPDKVSYHEGKQLVAEIFRRWDQKLCSFKQAKVLRKYGYNPDVSFAEASATIDALARNQWRRPRTTDHGLQTAAVGGQRPEVGMTAASMN